MEPPPSGRRTPPQSIDTSQPGSENPPTESTGQFSHSVSTTFPEMDDHSRSYTEFIRMGDSSPTPRNDSASSSTSVEQPPLTHTLANGSNSPSSHAANTTSNNERRTPASSPGNNSSSFFSSIFRKATSTLENSIQAAHQNGSEAFSSAHHHVSAASSTALSTVTGLVLDIGTTFNGQASRESPPSRPHATVALKPLRVVPPAIPLLFFYAPVPTIVSQSALNVFTADNPRPTSVPLNIVQTRATSSTSPAPPHAAVAATHAVVLPGPRLAVSHDDGAIVIFSLSASRVAAFEAATAPHPSPTTALTAVPPTGLAVARRDGSVHLLNAALQPVVNLPAPDLCAAPLTPTLTTAAAVALAAVPVGTPNPGLPSTALCPAIAAAYDDGTISTFSNMGMPTGPPFVAHAGAPAGLLPLFDASLIVTAGNATDRSLAVFERESGRCLARRALPFTPTCLQGITSTSPADNSPDACVCPSLNSFLVGGDESQVEAFRVVPLSAKKLDIKLVLNIGERQRGKKRSVLQIDYKSDSAVLAAVCESGEVRRWELCRTDAAQLCLLEEDLWIGATFTERNIVGMMERENSLPDNAPLNNATGIVRAQSILASILDDGSVPERLKDETVATFQKTQAAMMSTLSEAETEARRARRRIFGRFSAGVKSDEGAMSDLEKRLAKETRRAAAFEAEYVTRRYVEKVRDVEHKTVEKLKQLLTEFLKSIPRSNSLILEQARRDVEMLGTEEAEVEVD